jgi:chromosome segregation ATPase
MKPYVILTPACPFLVFASKSVLIGVTAMRSLLRKLTYAFALALLLLVFEAAAQQAAVGRQKAPRLTTDDVRPASEQPTAESKDPGKPEGTAKAEDSAKADGTDPKADQTKSSNPKVNAEESAWRDRLAKARDKAKRLEKASEEAELRITALRNDLGASGQSARQHNDTAAEIGQSGQRLQELQSEARAAAEDADQLSEYGKQRGFNEAEERKATSEDGKANEEYYRTKFAKLNEGLESAQRRIQLFDNRVRDLNQQISTNSGGRDKRGRGTGGDTFFALQLQKDRDATQQQLEEARSALTKAQADLDALREDARRAGVPPGVLR